MTFVFGYWMIFNLLKVEQIYFSNICNTMVLSSTIIIVSKMIEYGQESHNHRLHANPWYRE